MEKPHETLPTTSEHEPTLQKLNPGSSVVEELESSDEILSEDEVKEIMGSTNIIGGIKYKRGMVLEVPSKPEVLDTLIQRCPQGDLKDYLTKLKDYQDNPDVKAFPDRAQGVYVGNTPYASYRYSSIYESIARFKEGTLSAREEELMRSSARYAMELYKEIKAQFSELYESPYYWSLAEKSRGFLSIIFASDSVLISDLMFVHANFQVRDEE